MVDQRREREIEDERSRRHHQVGGQEDREPVDPVAEARAALLFAAFDLASGREAGRREEHREERQKTECGCHSGE